MSLNIPLPISVYGESAQDNLFYDDNSGQVSDLIDESPRRDEEPESPLDSTGSSQIHQSATMEEVLGAESVMPPKRPPNLSGGGDEDIYLWALQGRNTGQIIQTLPGHALQYD